MYQTPAKVDDGNGKKQDTKGGRGVYDHQNDSRKGLFLLTNCIRGKRPPKSSNYSLLDGKSGRNMNRASRIFFFVFFPFGGKKF